MKNLLAKTAGFKTYTVVLASLIYAGMGLFYFHSLSFDQAMQVVQVALGLGALRAAVK